MRKILKISFFIKKIYIGSCRYIQLEIVPNTNIFYLLLNNCDFDLSIIEEGVNIDVNISIYNKRRETLNIIDLIVIPYGDIRYDKDNVNMKAHILCKWTTDIYNQNLIDVFWALENDFFEWNSLSITKKEEALNALFKLNGWAKNILGDDFLISSDFIKNKYDFYYELTNKLVGENKYFASSLDSLEESLIHLAKEIRNKKITFSNYNHFSSILGKEYFYKIISLFESVGVKVG